MVSRSLVLQLFMIWKTAINEPIKSWSQSTTSKPTSGNKGKQEDRITTSFSLRPSRRNIVDLPTLATKPGVSEDYAKLKDDVQWSFQNRIRRDGINRFYLRHLELMENVLTVSGQYSEAVVLDYCLRIYVRFSQWLYIDGELE
ncbi:hypothetical protein BDV41DRAFT_583471 [Aspergillus transmontanensis]|uniref:Uncharacterized protein n=1 Tax=Aspergillus transmontanensis TaxID=1034304 RepID=A0A5N6VCW6_9EURO|nr:hypothetical protein BDV41DRAFT_583471 [Aspergillus transmontanensis]